MGPFACESLGCSEPQAGTQAPSPRRQPSISPPAFPARACSQTPALLVTACACHNVRMHLGGLSSNTLRTYRTGNRSVKAAMLPGNAPPVTRLLSPRNVKVHRDDHVVKAREESGVPCAHKHRRKGQWEPTGQCSLRKENKSQTGRRSGPTVGSYNGLNLLDPVRAKNKGHAQPTETSSPGRGWETTGCRAGEPHPASLSSPPHQPPPPKTSQLILMRPTRFSCCQYHL